MEITTYPSAAEFLKRSGTALESNETSNSLILGICQQLAANPAQVHQESAPCLKTVCDGDTLVIAAMMTPPHNLVLYGHEGDIATGAAVLANTLAAERWQIPGVFGPGKAPLYFARQWAEITHTNYIPSKVLRVYALREVQAAPAQKGKLRKAKKDEKALLAGWWHAFYMNIYGQSNLEDAENAVSHRITQGDLYVWDIGHPVSMAIKTRPTKHSISISMVYTPPQLRNRGYASACVSALCQLLLDAGWTTCALFADLANATSNHVYQKIGFKPVSDYEEYSFLK